MKPLFFYIVILFLLCACGENKNERDAADKLSEIEQLVVAEKYNAAKIALDSFHINFPEMISLRRKAIVLEDTLSMRQNRRIIAFCDSMLTFNQHKLDSLRTLFRFQKDEKYQVIGNYIYKNQGQNINMGSSFWTYIDQNNDFYIVKNFFGGLPKNSAISLTVSLGDIYATTDTILENSSARYKFETDGKTVETLTLKNEQIEKFAAFINQFSDKNISVCFGNSWKYQLSENEKRSISITYQFWKLQKELENLKIQKSKAIKKSTTVLYPSAQNQ